MPKFTIEMLLEAAGENEALAQMLQAIFISDLDVEAVAISPADDHEEPHDGLCRECAADAIYQYVLDAMEEIGDAGGMIALEIIIPQTGSEDELVIGGKTVDQIIAEMEARINEAHPGE